MRLSIFALFFAIVLAVSVTRGQSNDFTYQGKLTEGTAAANGPYDFQVKLFGSASGGTDLGTQSLNAVQVTNGDFSLTLNFGFSFSGLDRWLEISVKPSSGATFTTLAPRQPVTSAPYAMKSGRSGTADYANDAENLGGLASDQYVITNDPRLTDARNPLPGSSSYIQNTSSLQAASNFNISGNGTAGGTLTATTVNAIGGYRIGGIQIMSASTSPDGVNLGVGAGWNNSISATGNTFVGNGAGRVNNLGTDNSFFGKNAGFSNTQSNNSFFGSEAGFGNTSGTRNSYFGRESGRNNTSGSDNSFFGWRTGLNSTGSFNSFVGSGAGDSNTSGEDNSLFGFNAGTANQTGFRNSFFGSGAGESNTSGVGNDFFGYRTGSTTSTGSNNSFFGGYAGKNNSTGENNAFFGNSAGINNIFGSGNTFIGAGADGLPGNGNNNTAVGTGASIAQPNLSFATAIGSQSSVSTSNSVVLGRAADTVRVPGILNIAGTSLLNGNVIAGGTLSFATLGSGGLTALCLNSSYVIGTCSSSLRYKSAVKTFTRGLDVVRRLRPITFSWLDGGLKDVGFAAEEVNAVEPLLTTYNDRGEIEGVKYAQITTVLVNAVMEQEKRITEQEKIIESQQSRIDALTKLVCASNRKAEICKEIQK